MVGRSAATRATPIFRLGPMSRAGRRLQRLVRQASMAADPSCRVEHSSQCLINRLTGRKRLDNLWFEHHDVTLSPESFDVFAPNSAWHGGKVVLLAHFILRMAILFHRTVFLVVSLVAHL